MSPPLYAPSPPLPTTSPPGLPNANTAPASFPPSSSLPPPPTPTCLPLVAIDCASVGVAHQPRDGGYLNVDVSRTTTRTRPRPQP